MQITESIDDDEVDPQQAVGDPAGSALHLLTFQQIDEIDGRVETHAIAVASAPGDPEGGGEMRLAGTAAQHDILCAVDKGRTGQSMDQPRIDRESVEVEAHQVTVDRETHPRHLATDNGQRGVKSRSPHSNDNTRAEAKNEVVIRQNFGYVHIPQKHAAPINTLCANHLAPHLNLHRPCLLPKRTPDAKGKVRVTYPLERVQISLRSCKPCPSQAATCSAASPSTASPPKLGPPAIVPPLRNSRRLAQASFQPSLDGLPPKSPDA